MAILCNLFLGSTSSALVLGIPDCGSAPPIMSVVWQQGVARVSCPLSPPAVRAAGFAQSGKNR